MLRWIAVLLLTAVAGAAQAGAPTPAELSELSQHVREVSEAWEAADHSTLEKLLASDFLHVDGYGHVQSRAEFIDAAGSRGERRVALSDVQAHVHGDAVVMTGQSTLTPSGVRALRFTQAWVREGGAWKLAAFQVTAVQP